MQHGGRGLRAHRHHRARRDHLRVPVGRRPNQAYQRNVRSDKSIGNSIYHGLQVKAERRMARGFTFLTAYTWSKAISGPNDIGGQVGGGNFIGAPQDIYYLQGGRRVAGFDVTQRFVQTILYDVPFLRNKKGALGLLHGGWQLSTIMTFQSGFPAPVTNNVDTTGTGINSRPDQSANGNLPAISAPGPSGSIPPLREAIRITAIDEEMSRYKTFTTENKWLPPGEFNTSALVQLMASRRSCRCFIDQPIDRARIEDLIKIGITAPSGTNSQRWRFTVLPTRKAVTALAELIASYFGQLNTTAEKTMLRLFLKLIGKGELDAYYRGYYRKVKEALEAWHGAGKDRLFHGSTAAIVVGSRPGASCPAEDALLATQNILLA